MTKLPVQKQSRKSAQNTKKTMEVTDIHNIRFCVFWIFPFSIFKLSLNIILPFKYVKGYNKKLL